MYICVLSSPPDDPDIPYDPSPYLEQHRWDQPELLPYDLESQVQTLAAKNYDLYFNLCDGTPDDDLPGIGLVQTLEKLGLAFTGADSRFFDPTRAEMKAAAKQAGVPTPGSVFADEPKNIAKAAATLRFPLIVKPPHGFSSFGISRESRVTNVESLEMRAMHAIREFGKVLIEEFIDGREFTALVAEDPDDPAHPVTFQTVEFVFPPDESFKHYDMKWKDYERMKVIPTADKDIDRRLRDLTSRLFITMHGNGYARCDFRMDAAGNLYMLEINPNCGVLYPPSEPGSADWILLSDPRGHAGFIDLIFRGALKRRAK
jgi:D-alanine-D-alanine ligase